MTIELTPEIIGDACKRHLSAAELAVCTEAALRRTDEVTAAANLLAPDGFASEADVAAWWLSVCRAALRGGCS